MIAMRFSIEKKENPQNQQKIYHTTCHQPSGKFLTFVKKRRRSRRLSHRLNDPNSPPIFDAPADRRVATKNSSPQR
jgi:hypothetical protein